MSNLEYSRNAVLKDKILDNRKSQVQHCRLSRSGTIDFNCLLSDKSLSLVTSTSQQYIFHSILGVLRVSARSLMFGEKESMWRRWQLWDTEELNFHTFSTLESMLLCLKKSCFLREKKDALKPLF